jgi:hypothetical protein
VRQSHPIALGEDPEEADIRFNAAYDEHHLYVSCEVLHNGVMSNAGNDPRLFFKSGAAVDLKIGADPAADPERQQPAPGDCRLLMTYVGGRPRAILYVPVAPDAPAGEHWETYTPAGGRAAFDRVVELQDAKMLLEERRTREGDYMGYCLSAAIPLKSIGLQIEPGRRIRFDWGVLISDTGNDVRRRRYWANRANTGTSDAPREARIHPRLWGYMLFGEEKKSAFERMQGELPLLDGGADDVDAPGVDDIIEELQDL